jgi:hypothetical protein
MPVRWFDVIEKIAAPLFDEALRKRPNVSESGHPSADSAMLGLDGHSCHRTGLRRAELR